MKTVQIIGNRLHENLLVAITSSINTPTLSLAINVTFIEYGAIQKARLLLHSKETLCHDGSTKDILSFTGTMVTEELSRPCIGYYYTDNLIEECWVTIIEPETELFETNINKTDFIGKCKEYYQSQGLEFTEEGNLVNGFPIFRKEKKTGDPSELFTNKDRSIEVYTEMHNNLFPIWKTKDGKSEVFFGEFINENMIRTCSKDEAFLRGVSLC
jgi:hypothetical protein